MRKSILAIGEPMAGKTTALEKLALNFPNFFTHISTGNLMRQFVEQNPSHPITTEELKPMFAGGALASDETTAHIFNSYVQTLDTNLILLLDGVIRKTTQIEFEYTLDLKLLGVMHFDVSKLSDEELLQRALNRGRSEETPEVVAQRRANYRKSTEPLVHYYRGRGLLENIDASKNKADTYTQVATRSIKLILK